MAVFPPGFSERVFEFSFNAEYAALNKAILAGVPHIPTQNEEKYLGYDVAFAIQSAGGVVNTLALQHKVARRVDSLSGSNAHFCATAGVPYFAFRLDVLQFNTIQAIVAAGLPGIEIYYCAPSFTTTTEMDAHYMGNSVASNAVWIDVSGVTPLSESEPHSIVYSGTGSDAWVFSGEPKQLKVRKPPLGKDRNHRNSRKPLGQDALRKIYDFIYPKAIEYWNRRRTQPKASGEEKLPLPAAPPMYQEIADEPREVIAIRNLLSSYLGLSVLIEVVPGSGDPNS